MNKTVIATILSSKIIIFLLIFFAYSFFPFNARMFYLNFVYPHSSSVTLATAYATWDAQHYLYLSDKGYSPGIDSNAFSYLLPFCIHLLRFLTGNTFLAGILFANIVSFLGLYLFYEVVKRTSNEKIAYTGLCALLAFPTSFYFSLIYTEGLFLCLVMGLFLFLQQKNIVMASVIALGIPLARLIGFVIILPFFFSYILEYKGHRLQDEVIYIGKSLWNMKTLLIFSPVIGLLASMCIMYITTGNFFAQFLAQKNFISQYSFFSIFNPIFFLRALFTFPLVLHGFTNSLLDRVFFLSFLGFLPFIYKRVSFPFFIYTLLFGLLPVLSGSFMSYMRYLVIVFPLFITLGRMSQEKKYAKFVFPLLFMSMMLQALFIIMHSLNYWVA